MDHSIGPFVRDKDWSRRLKAICRDSAFLSPLKAYNLMMPVVSVCIPTYNGAAYLSQCLDSVMQQTCQSMEILVVDDGSSDDSGAIAQRYEGVDRRVRVIANKEHLGLVENWNRCVDLANGEWIKFVFQDDHGESSL